MLKPNKQQTTAENKNQKSVWDGYIIPHKIGVSPIFECLWKLKKGE